MAAAAAGNLKMLSTIGYSGTVRGGLLIHPDNQHLIYVLGATIVVQALDAHKSQLFLHGHTNHIVSLCLSKTGKYLASGQQALPGANADIIVWDMTTFEIVQRLSLHKVTIASMAFAANDKYLVSLGGEGDNRVVVWDVAHGKAISGAPATNMERALAVESLDGEELKFVTVGINQIRIWTINKSDGRLIPVEVRMGGIKREMTCLVIDSEAKRAYIGTTSGDLLDIDVANAVFKSNGPLDKRGHSLILKGIEAVRLLAPGVLLAGCGAGTVWKLNAGADFAPIGRHSKLEGGVTSIAPFGDGQTCYVGTADSRMYEIVTSDMGPTLRSTAPVGDVHGCSFPYGASEIVAICSGSVVSVRDTKNGEELLRCDEPAEASGTSAAGDGSIAKAKPECRFVHVPRNGRSIVSGWSDGRIRAHKPESGTIMYTINNAHQKGVTAVLSFADDLANGGNGGATGANLLRLVSAGGDGQVRTWRIGRDSQSLENYGKEHKGEVTALAMTEDGSKLLSCSVDCTAVLWNLTSDGGITPVKTFFASAALRGVGFVGENEIVCAGAERKLLFFDMTTGRKTREVDVGTAITALIVSNDHSRIIVAGADTALRVYNSATGALMTEGDAEVGETLILSIAPNAEFLLSCTDTGAVYKWSY